jgi:DNA-3-methyladenine glycosylase
MRLQRSDYRTDATSLAPALLGCTLVRVLPDGTRVAGRIVETEAYAGPADQAAHTRNGHRSPRNEVMWGAAGLCYVYFTYGMHHCMNIVCAGVGIPEAVLIRALEPVESVETMRANRSPTATARAPRKHPLRDRDLCSGPARLCQALGITLEQNGLDLTAGDEAWNEPADAGASGGLSEAIPTDRIVNTTRVGIDSAGPEWAGKRWRWYDGGSAHISRR